MPSQLRWRGIITYILTTTPLSYHCDRKKNIMLNLNKDALALFFVGQNTTHKGEITVTNIICQKKPFEITIITIICSF
jgi:hypothetical protein